MKTASLTILQALTACLGAFSYLWMAQGLGHYAAPIQEVLAYAVYPVTITMLVGALPFFLASRRIIEKVSGCHLDYRLVGIVGFFQGALIEPISRLAAGSATSITKILEASPLMGISIVMGVTGLVAAIVAAVLVAVSCRLYCIARQ